MEKNKNSIRKVAAGTASVVVGSLLLFAIPQQAEAEEVVDPEGAITETAADETTDATVEVTEDSAVEVVEEPVAEDEVVEEPVVDETVEEPVVEEEVVEEPVVDETVEEPVVDETVEEPVVEEPPLSETSGYFVEVVGERGSGTTTVQGEALQGTTVTATLADGTTNSVIVDESGLFAIDFPELEHGSEIGIHLGYEDGSEVTATVGVQHELTDIEQAYISVNMSGYLGEQPDLYAYTANNGTVTVVIVETGEEYVFEADENGLVDTVFPVVLENNTYLDIIFADSEGNTHIEEDLLYTSEPAPDDGTEEPPVDEEEPPIDEEEPPVDEEEPPVDGTLLSDGEYQVGEGLDLAPGTYDVTYGPDSTTSNVLSITDPTDEYGGGIGSYSVGTATGNSETIRVVVQEGSVVTVQGDLVFNQLNGITGEDIYEDGSSNLNHGVYEVGPDLAPGDYRISFSERSGNLTVGYWSEDYNGVVPHDDEYALVLNEENPSAEFTLAEGDFIQVSSTDHFLITPLNVEPPVDEEEPPVDEQEPPTEEEALQSETSAYTANLHGYEGDGFLTIDGTAVENTVVTVTLPDGTEHVVTVGADGTYTFEIAELAVGSLVGVHFAFEDGSEADGELEVQYVGDDEDTGTDEDPGTEEDGTDDGSGEQGPHDGSELEEGDISYENNPDFKYGIDINGYNQDGVYNVKGYTVPEGQVNVTLANGDVVTFYADADGKFNEVINADLINVGDVLNVLFIDAYGNEQSIDVTIAAPSKDKDKDDSDDKDNSIDVADSAEEEEKLPDTGEAQNGLLYGAAALLAGLGTVFTFGKRRKKNN